MVNRNEALSQIYYFCTPLPGHERGQAQNGHSQGGPQQGLACSFSTVRNEQIQSYVSSKPPAESKCRPVGGRAAEHSRNREVPSHQPPE